MKRDRVVVVGAAGFIGRACAKALATHGIPVDCVDLVEVSVPGVSSWTVADVLINGVPGELLLKADTLINFAWRNDPGRGNSDMAGDVQSNVAAAVRSFEDAARAGVRRIIYPSSGGTIYGATPPLPTPESAPIRPVGGYGAGKAAAELYLHAIALAYGTETCALRIGNPYGPGQLPERGQGFIATAVARTLNNLPIQIFGTASLARDYVYISDVSEAFVRAVKADKVPPVLNLGSGLELSLEELIQIIFNAAGRHTEVEYLPARRVDVPRVQLDISLIHQALGWEPTTSIDEGVGKTVKWLRDMDSEDGAGLIG
jgi:UDP-glucose 4-epimerase